MPETYLVDGNLTLVNPEARNQISRAMSDRDVELDFSYAAYIDSVGLECLRDLYRAVSEKSGSLRFVGMNNVIQDILRVLEPDLFALRVAS